MRASQGDEAEGGRGERIAKVIARAGLASRREAEAWIVAGRVAVNGEVIGSPARNVTAADRVTVDGAPLPTRERTRLFLYHKPRGLVTTHADPAGRATIFSVLPKGLPRLISVGRLDINTEGLVLLTNDGGLARLLELPSTGWLRRYRVRAHGRVTQADLDRLRGGITIEGVRYGPIEAMLEREQGSNVWLVFAIREGKNREVKNVLGHLGLSVNRLIRVSFGPFQLGELAEGEIAEVRARTLREQLGERIMAAAGIDLSGPTVQHREPPGREDVPAPPTWQRRSRTERLMSRPTPRHQQDQRDDQQPPHQRGKPGRDKPRRDKTNRDEYKRDKPKRDKPKRDKPKRDKPKRDEYRRSHGDPDRIGQPERARQERKRRRPSPGKRR
ncbi:MAG: rRNA pseudouridine synthase [Hyphomicrobiales bacterium]|nr:rRNA pseudouridine synthase [Hyphomicrobiales bacterium]